MTTKVRTYQQDVSQQGSLTPIPDFFRVKHLLYLHRISLTFGPRVICHSYRGCLCESALLISVDICTAINPHTKPPDCKVKNTFLHLFFLMYL